MTIEPRPKLVRIGMPVLLASALIGWQVRAAEPSPLAQSAGTSALFADPLLGGRYAAAKNGVAWGEVNENRGSVRFTSEGLRFRFDAGVINSFAEQRFRVARTFDTWIGFDLTIPPNYNHRKNPNSANNPDCKGDCADNNKLLNLWGGSDYNKPSTVGMGVNLWPTAEGTSAATVYYFGVSRAEHDWSAMPKAIEREDIGKAVGYLFHFYAPTATTRGGLQAWKRRDGKWIQICDSKAPQWGYQNGQAGWDQGYLLGWANSGYAQQTDFFVRNFAVYPRDPRQ